MAIDLHAEVLKKIREIEFQFVLLILVLLPILVFVLDEKLHKNDSLLGKSSQHKFALFLELSKQYVLIQSKKHYRKRI